ncbi:hypothetical protein HRED_06442, partial [Candidatus Haloredivivus sp. G17]
QDLRSGFSTLDCRHSSSTVLNKAEILEIEGELETPSD